MTLLEIAALVKKSRALYFPDGPNDEFNRRQHRVDASPQVLGARVPRRFPYSRKEVNGNSSEREKELAELARLPAGEGREKNSPNQGSAEILRGSAGEKVAQPSGSVGPKLTTLGQCQCCCDSRLKTMHQLWLWLGASLAEVTP